MSVRMTPVLDYRHRGQVHLSCAGCGWVTVSLNATTAEVEARAHAAHVDHQRQYDAAGRPCIGGGYEKDAGGNLVPRGAA